jgi:tetratricopeptide (TPR) repeat protein
MRYRILAIAAVLVAVTRLVAVAPAAAQQQAPWKGKNLQYFPADIKREALVQRMREFSFALGVRCQHCHTGGDGISFDGVDFASDDKQAKVKARAMLRMTDEINTSLLPKVPSRAEPRVSVDCATCHRGVRLPKSLQTTLFEIATAEGAPAAVARYRALRSSDTLSGKYNFGEWEINELARRLAGAKKPEAAIALLEMNGEFYPRSPAIDYEIGELRLAAGDREKALASFRQALAKAPDDARLKARIAELEKKAPEKP